MAAKTKRKPDPTLKRYAVRMKVELSGAEAFVSAFSPEHAREMAKSGVWEDDGIDFATAEVINWKIQSVSEDR